MNDDDDHDHDHEDEYRDSDDDDDDIMMIMEKTFGHVYSHNFATENRSIDQVSVLSRKIVFFNQRKNRGMRGLSIDNKVCRRILESCNILMYFFHFFVFHNLCNIL